MELKREPEQKIALKVLSADQIGLAVVSAGTGTINFTKGYDNSETGELTDTLKAFLHDQSALANPIHLDERPSES